MIALIVQAGGGGLAATASDKAGSNLVSRKKIIATLTFLNYLYRVAILCWEGLFSSSVRTYSVVCSFG